MFEIIWFNCAFRYSKFKNLLQKLKKKKNHNLKKNESNASTYISQELYTNPSKTKNKSKLS